MKAYWRSGGIDPCSLDFGTRWRWVVSFTPRPLYPQGKSPWYPLDRRLGGPQSRSGCGDEEKNSQPPPGIEFQLLHISHNSLFLTKYHALKAYWGSGGTVPHVPDLGTRWRWVVSFTTRPLYRQGKSPWYTLDRRLSGPQSRSEYNGKEKNPTSCRDSNPWSFSLKLCSILSNFLQYLKKIVPVLNQASRHEDVLGEWRYSPTTHS
jgi:hypothetical protein